MPMRRKCAAALAIAAFSLAGCQSGGPTKVEVAAARCTVVCEHAAHLIHTGFAVA